MSSAQITPDPRTIVIMGPTASGKSKLAFTLAQQINAEIISADSIAFYRGFNIASAKPSRDAQAQVKHHLINVLDAHEPADVGWFCQMASQAISSCHQRHQPVVVVGGSGLYLRGLLGHNFHQLPTDSALRHHLCQQTAPQLMRMLQARDPQRASQIHPHDHFRLARACEITILSGKTIAELTTAPTAPPHINGKILCCLIQPCRATLLKNIQLRTYQMLNQGLVNEVQTLLDQGIAVTTKPMKSIGYKQTVAFIQNSVSAPTPPTPQELCQQIIVATRQLAKKQHNWFRHQHYDLITDNHSHAKILRDITDWFKS